MKNLIQIIKSINVKQVLTVFLAGCLVVVSTACSQDKITQAGNKVEAAMSDTYDKYDANQDPKGGMNGYNDDRRYDAKTAAKTKKLVDTAKNRQRESFSEYFEEATDNAQDALDDAAKATKSTARNIKESLKDLS